MSKTTVAKKAYYAWHPAEFTYGDYMGYFSKQEPVLDVGCGSGWLGKLHPLMHGVDHDSGAVALAKKFEKAQVCDIVHENLPFAPNYFGGVIAKDIIEHVPSATDFIEKVSAVLKPGGIVYLQTKLPIADFWSDYTHVRPYNYQALSSLFADNGYKIIDWWYTGNWPGLGVFLRLTNLRKTPRVFRFLTFFGINRNNICVVAKKIANTPKPDLAKSKSL